MQTLRSRFRAALLAIGVLGGPCELRAQSASEPLRLTSSPEALADPRVQRCRQLAGRRADPALDAIWTAVENAGMQLELGPVFDAVATCRAALRAFPTDPQVIVAHATASDMLLVIALGLRFPDSLEQQFVLVNIDESLRAGAPSGFGGQLVGFFLGSANEYGVGTPVNRAAAMRWYELAANAGDAISRRELERLQRAQP